MNKTEYIGKLNALYVGDKNCLEELITAYDEKDKEIERLNNIIKEVREYILTHKLYCFKYDEEELFEITTDKKAKDELLEILDKVGSDKE